MSKLYIGQLPGTPIGDLWIGITEVGFAALAWDADPGGFSARLTRRFKLDVAPDPVKTAAACTQVDEYLRGKRRTFDLPVDWSLLRPFQREVLQATFAIPYGETRTYGELAHELGRPHAARAVGRAEATNPLPLVIPCHRVIGSDGKLHGYGGGEGLPTKEWLLRLEGAVLA
jgi:methylated-DNA-[protein]-cysteine S-methyltransferase